MSAAAVLLGAAIGAVLGLTGAGGGMLAVPALVFALGLPFTQAAPVALLAIAVAALLGALDGLKRGLVRYRAAALMAAAGIVAAPLGVRAAAALPERVLLLAFAAVLVLVAVRMLRRPRAPQAVTAPPPCRVDPATGRLRWSAATAATLGAIGATAGFLSGLLGVGGGFAIVPALQRASDIEMRGIVATSLAVIALVSLGSVAAAWQHGALPDFGVALPFAAGAAAGMLAARLGARRAPALLLQRAFAVVALAVAALMAAHALR